MNYNINESKRGLNSKKIYQLAKEHGGLRPRHGYFFRRFNELTDDDVIGLIEKPELNRYENASWKIKKEWAEQKGYNVNIGDSVEFIPMADWSWVGVIVRGDLLPDKEWKETPYGKKITDRSLNKVNDGSRHYVWSDTDTHGVEGLRGFSKKAHEFAIKKYNNEINENNMSKIVLKEEELMTLVNESVKRVINEAIQNGELDETRVGNFFRSVFGGAQDAVGDDIDNAKNAVKGAWENTKDAAGRAWQNTKKAVGDVGKGIQKRATVFKNSFNANQAYQKIMDIRKDIDDVLNSGLITGEQSVAALKNAKRCLQNLAASRKGVNSQKNKRIMNSNEEE